VGIERELPVMATFRRFPSASSGRYRPVASTGWMLKEAVAPAVVVMMPAPVEQGLALVHFSAQLERILWDRGAFRGCLGDV